MRTKTVVLTFLTISVAGALADKGQEALAQRPSFFEQRRKFAPEKLVVRVDHLERVRIREDGPVDWYVAHSTVTKSMASETGIVPGSKIKFLTYFIPEESRRTYAGPLPPKLHAGWSGDVYLNHVDPDNQYDGKHAKLIMWSFGKKYDIDKATKLQPRRRR